MLQLSVFETSLGWFGLLGAADEVHLLTIGHSSGPRAQEAACASAVDAPLGNWWPDLRERLEQFTCGVPQSFDDVRVSFGKVTAFRRRVLRACRNIGWGRTRSYGELARQVGQPNAARAVGGAMAANPCPLIVPCHRVIGASGRLVGFSAPQGLSLKERLLEMEAGRELAARVQS
jgi:methylated-DNA-[protein]-cysteine S-methyltransferase